MAISRTRTLLSLDRYAKIMGLSPLRFNGASPVVLSDDNVLYPMVNDQETLWSQYEYQNPGFVSREQLALLIQNAEHDIVNFLGYLPTPDWIEQERNDLASYGNHSDRIYSRALQTKKSKIIAGGVRKSVAVSENIEISFQDINSDGFYETGRITFADPGYPLEQIKVYFSGQDGDRTYEIRPPRSKKKSGSDIVIDFDIWMLIDPDVWDEERGENSRGIELDDFNNIVDTLDVYREYNDTTQDSVVFHGYDQNVMTEYGGYLVPLDNMGYVSVYNGDYNTSTGLWECNSIIGLVDYVDLWYYCGDKNPSNQSTRNHDDYISNSIATAIAYIATSRIPQGFMSNNNVVSLFEDLRYDYTSEPDRNGFVPFDIAVCPFGNRKGEYRAWNMIKNFQSRRFNSVTI